MKALRHALLLGLLWCAPAVAQAPALAAFGTDDIYKLMSGTTIRAVGALSRRPVLLTFQPNQSLSGRFEPPHEHETDTGKWWARDGRLCWQWTKWEDQKVNCIRLAYENGAVARWHPSNGTRLADWAIRTAGPRVAELGAPAVAAARAAPARPAAPPPERFDDIHFGNHHALVIGNNAYRKLNTLKSAENDARAVAAVLVSAYGHKVELILNATRAQVIAAR
ncbi:MAG: caspase family protein, partial [Rhodospirillaceae bacterium]